MKILVIDDQAASRHIIATILQQAGYETYEAYSVEYAMEIVREVNPDVVCCDLMMPGSSGIDFVKFCQGIPEIAQIPIIIITASGEAGLKTQALEMGAAKCIDKPFSHKDLLKVVKDILEQ